WRRLVHLVGRFLGRTDGPVRLLDWGCGCGAIARHAIGDQRFTYAGADIDADNISWCTETMGPRFAALGIHPPMPFVDGAFDVAIGISVMTHLRHEDQVEWLGELARVTRRGGLCILSVLGIHAAAKAPEYAKLLAQNGYLFCPADAHEINRIIDVPGYY